MRTSVTILSLLLATSPLPGQAPPLMGFRLGTVRDAPMRVLPCTRAGHLDTCQASDSVTLDFLGDTVVAITYVRTIGLTAQRPATIWLNQFSAWTTRLFGTPDSVRGRDSSVTATDGPLLYREVQAYWTGPSTRSWRATALIVHISISTGEGPAIAAVIIQCRSPSQFGDSHAECPHS